MAEEGHIPPRNHGWKEVSAPMEYGTPLEILPVEITFNLPHVYLLVFDYLFEALTSSLLIIFGFLSNYFFSTFLSPRGGRYLLLQLRI